MSVVREAKTREEEPHFEPDSEADLNHVLKNQRGTPANEARPRTDLRPIAKTIPNKPPAPRP
jgi:carboxyl-terminal processing protease